MLKLLHNCVLNQAKGIKGLIKYSQTNNKNTLYSNCEHILKVFKSSYLYRKNISQDFSV